MSNSHTDDLIAYLELVAQEDLTIKCFELVRCVD